MRKGEIISPLLSELRQAHVIQPRADVTSFVKRQTKANAIVNAINAEVSGIEEPKVHVVVSVPRVELNYTANVVFKWANGTDRFLSAKRGLLAEVRPSQEIDELAFNIEDVRDETIWERQKSLYASIYNIDRQRDRNTQDTRPESISDRVTYETVLAYLQTSKEVEEAYPHLANLFEYEEEGDNVVLFVGQPTETNLPERLWDSSTPSLLRNKTDMFSTQLAGLKEMKRRAIEGSRDLHNLIAADIFDILDLNL